MGWNPLKDIAKAAKKIADVAFTPTKVAVDLVKGKKPEDVVKDAITAPIDAAASVASTVSNAEQEFLKLAGDAIAKISPQNEDLIKKIFNDFHRITNIYDAENIEQNLKSVQKFVETGDIKYLNPLISLTAAEIERARNIHWDQAASVPQSVLSQMPGSLQDAATKARYIEASKAAETSLPAFATQHLDRAKAIVMIDLIFFDEVPSSSGNQDLHLWAHELHHVNQYSTLGLQEFVSRYLGEEIGFQAAGDQGNSLELEADTVACKAFWIPNPVYLPGPCP